MIANLITTVIVGLALLFYAGVVWAFANAIKQDLKVDHLTWFVWLVCASVAMPVVTLVLRITGAGLKFLIG